MVCSSLCKLSGDTHPTWNEGRFATCGSDPRLVVHDPAADAHAHDRAITRLVNHQLRFAVPNRAEYRDPRPQLDLALVQQVPGGELCEGAPLAGLNPAHQ